MTVVSLDLGRPRPAAQRGGDCRARDLAAGLNVFGPHRFTSPPDCRINNGFLRVTVGTAGVAPSLAIEAYRPAVTVGDYLSDILADVLDGSMSVPAWISMGTVTIDSPLVSAVLTSARLARVSRAAVTVRLVASAVADVYVTLRRGEPMVRIQHGSTRPPLVTTDRRVRWTGPPALTGTASTGRVTELLPTVEGLPRFVASHDSATADAGAFSLTASAVATATFGAGIGVDTEGERPDDLHSQLADASGPQLVVA